MPAVYDAIDVAFGWNGDLGLSSEGDIDDTSDDALLSLRQQIHCLCASAFGDWEIYESRAAGLDDFVGEPNTRSRAEALRERIHLTIVSAGIVADEDLRIRVLPVHIHKVLVVININALATAFNNLEPGEPVQIALVYDSLEQQVLFYNKTPKLIGG